VDTAKRILDAARALRGDLPELNVAGADDLDRQVTDLLAAAEDGRRVEDDLLELLRSDPRTRVYTQYFMEHGVPPEPDQVARRGYGPLPGRPGPVPLPKYSCPYGDYDWYQRSVGQSVPRCPTHDVALEPVDQGGR
jgi:hypothetical protein